MMTREVKVEVTAADITEAKRRLAQNALDDFYNMRSQNCPLALALKRAAGGFKAMVGGGFAFYDAEGRGWRGDLPDEAEVFVARFDSDQTVGPASFTLVAERGGL